MSFWQFFRQGWDGRALLVRPSRIPHWIWKILFVLSSYEFLAMLEGKIWKCPFFRVQSDEITVWMGYSSPSGLGSISEIIYVTYKTFCFLEFCSRSRILMHDCIDFNWRSVTTNCVSAYQFLGAVVFPIWAIIVHSFFVYYIIKYSCIFF